jgi:hypothetical protein
VGVLKTKNQQQFPMTLLLSFSEVRDLLMNEADLRYREAEALLKDNQPPPVEHQLHSRRRWRRDTVLDFIEKVKQGNAPLGKGVSAAESNL